MLSCLTNMVCLLIGTNNARLAAMLRQLAVYHGKDANNLFMVRLAQGLTHLGKGTLTLSPYHSDKALMSPVAVAGLLAVCVSCLDVKNRKFILKIKFILQTADSVNKNAERILK